MPTCYGAVKTRVIANFACQHLQAAVLFRDNAADIESLHNGESLGNIFSKIRSYTSGCILSSAAALEALINELFIAENCSLRSKFTDFEEEFWGKGGIEWEKILDKYDRALSMLDKNKMDKNSTIYRDARALIEFRNTLIHYKPTWDPDRRKKIDLINDLKGKYALSPFVDHKADFITEQSMSAGCADWAIKSVLAFLYEFDDHTHLDDSKMAGFWRLE